MPKRSLYYEFDRETWRRLALKTPMPLTDRDVKKLASLGDPTDLYEADAIYRPLSALLEDWIESQKRVSKWQRNFFDLPDPQSIPFIIGIAGSVAVGKSTTARLLQHLLARSASKPKVDLVTTDGYLYSNAELERRGLMARKGFPESYNRGELLRFLAAVKSGAGKLQVPVYSHITYDVTDQYQLVDRPDVLIVEGVNVLQPAKIDSYKLGSFDLEELEYPQVVAKDKRTLAVSDFFDFSIYVDADPRSIEDWFVQRFLRLKRTAFENKDSYFQVYAGITDQVAQQIATDIWHSINLPNLLEEILPTRSRATLVIQKAADHRVSKVFLRKI